MNFIPFLATASSYSVLPPKAFFLHSQFFALSEHERASFRFVLCFYALDSLMDTINEASLQLWTAAKDGDSTVVGELLGQEGVDSGCFNPNDDDGRTPLMAAASNGHRDIVTILADAGVSLDEENEVVSASSSSISLISSVRFFLPFCFRARRPLTSQVSTTTSTSSRSCMNEVLI